MIIIYICLLLSLMVQAVLKASGVDPSSAPEGLILPAMPAAIVNPAHLEAFEDCFPPLSTHKDIGAKHDLIVRIDRLYGAHLKDNPNFYRLITPLINAEADNHMSFVWSDCRLSYLKLYTETIRPPIFTFDEVLTKLTAPNGQERYAFFMTRVSSFPQPVDLSRTVWANIFTINEAQFRTISEVLAALDRHPDLKEHHIQNVFESMFRRSIWDKAHWRRFIGTLRL